MLCDSASSPVDHQDIVQGRRLRAAVLWPHPRLPKLTEWRSDPTAYEPLDGLSRLPTYGIDIDIVDPLPFPLNPFAHKGTLLAGTDIIRASKVFSRYREFDVILSIGESPAFWFSLARRLFGLQKPIIIIDPALALGYRNRQRLQRVTFPRTARIIVYGMVQSTFLHEHYDEQVSVSFLHHRIDTEFFDGRKPEFPPAASSFPVVSVGGDVMRDFETLCHAVTDSDLRIQIYTRKLVECPIPGNVEIIKNWISYPQLRDIYRRAPLVVVPLHSALHPSGINALLEAMAMGKPVVVSASKGILDYVEHGRTAWVVPPDDPKALREGILHLLNNPDLSASLGRQARLFCEANCALNVYGQRLATMIRDVCAERS